MHRSDPGTVPAPGRPLFANDTEHGRDRQHWSAAANDPVTLPRLAALGVGPGWHCLEIGAGGGSVSRWLAGRVLPGGSVLASDRDPSALRPEPGLRVAALDVTVDPLPEAVYDLIVARLVLQHLPTRETVLGRLVRALRPGGVLHVDEFDASYEPPLLTPGPEAEELYLRFLAAKGAAMRAAGGDPHWGRKAPAALRAAGLVDLDVHIRVAVRHAGEPGLGLQLNHTHNLRDQLLEQGLTDGDLERVRALMRDPSFLAASSVFYSVQGRRPADTDR
ncbi:class I SAM-dependent methyltransferase [Streptomyces sp. NPDC050560]|uniref:class I SAM-dependent methyltransferase n=1 Tax=Streptomyces sp. NPDC050560 TaxID=3365630 RepID=UPI00378A8781